MSIELFSIKLLISSWRQEKTEEMIEYIYSLASDNKLAPLSISLILNADENVERSAHFLKRALPNLSISINPRQHPWQNVDNIKSLAVYLRPWIHHELLKGVGLSPLFNQYCCYFYMLET